MDLKIRKHYIDNLRWIILLILIPYHTAQAWNTWGEPNYIFIEGNRLISSIIVFFSPYFMPLLFLLAGISTKYALQKRTSKEYLAERVKRLLVPFMFGTIAFMPLMSYIGDKFNYSYNEGFLKHYVVFFTKYTDLTGADGGFSVGQFWFLLYLLIISIVSVGIIALLKKVIFKSEKTIPFWVVLFQYILYGIMGNKTCILFIGTVLLSYLATFICCEISSRIPVLCFLTGTKYNPNM